MCPMPNENVHDLCRRVEWEDPKMTHDHEVAVWRLECAWELIL